MEAETQDWEQIKSLFHDALEVEASGRRRFLAQRSGSAEIRVRVEQLLLAHESDASFLAHAAVADELWQAAPIPPRLAVGSLLVERFEIVRFIACGGMGEVYEALDLELQSKVAIKTIRPEIAAVPSALARFKREVQLARQVTHPNVCRIFDIFRHRDPLQTANDVVFVSMELLCGDTLAERLKQGGAIGQEEVLSIVRQVIPALGAAHTAGILHRDLKPGNILLEPGRDGCTRAVITDFGLAWSLDGQSETPLSITGQPSFGTPEYMSPEQIEGRPLTPASDLYSLGLVTYRMLTGSKAFGGDTPLMAALRRIQETPLPPSRLTPGLDKRWDAILTRCLDPHPALRFATAAELMAAIEAPEKPAQHPAIQKFAGMRQGLRRRWAWAAGVVALAAVTAGTIVVAHRMKEAAPTSVTYVLADFVNTTGEPVFDNTLNLALGAKLQQSPYLVRLPDTKIHSVLDMLRLPANQRLTKDVAMAVCQRLECAAVLQGSIANGPEGYVVALNALDRNSGKVLATKQVAAGGQESVLEALDQAADGIRPSLGESLSSIQRYNVPLWQATTPSLEALTAFSEGHVAWNAAGEAAALPYFEQAVQIDPNFAMAWARMGTVYGNIGATEKSNQALSKAFELRDRVTELERYYIVSHYYAFVTGEIDKEMQTYEQWAAAYPHDMEWTINLSVDYSIIGNYEKAIELQRRAIHEAPGNAPSYGDLAQLYLAIDHPDEARAMLDEAEQLHLNDGNIDLALYSLAFYNGDTAAMKNIVAAAGHRAGIEDLLLAQQAAAEDREGQLSAGRQLAGKAAEAARLAGDSEVSANWLALEATRQAELGANEAARKLMAQALAVPKAAQGSDVEVLAAYAAAINGDLDQARKLLADVTRAHPLDSIIQHYWAPILRARIALGENKPAQTVEELAGTEPYDLGIFEPGQCMDAAYLRGKALLIEHEPVQAADQFRGILAHRGLVLNCPTGALAQLGLARALAQAGDTAGSRTAYQDLLVLWKDADKDFRLGRQAQAEYLALR
jgi:tetratricopeptide (TPR) repeat protein